MLTLHDWITLQVSPARGMTAERIVGQMELPPMISLIITPTRPERVSSNDAAVSFSQSEISSPMMREQQSQEPVATESEQQSQDPKATLSEPSVSITIETKQRRVRKAICRELHTENDSASLPIDIHLPPINIILEECVFSRVAWSPIKDLPSSSPSSIVHVDLNGEAKLKMDNNIAVRKLLLHTASESGTPENNCQLLNTASEPIGSQQIEKRKRIVKRKSNTSNESSVASKQLCLVSDYIQNNKNRFLSFDAFCGPEFYHHLQVLRFYLNRLYHIR